MAITDSTALVMDNTSDTADQYDPAHDFHSLNAMLNLYDANGNIQFDKDKQAERVYMTGHVAENTVKFGSTAERLAYLIDNQYYDKAVFDQYSPNSWTPSTTTSSPKASNSTPSSARSSSTRPTRSRASTASSTSRTSRSAPPQWPWNWPPATKTSPSSTPMRSSPAASSPPRRPS
jgi:hypothetical protein